MTKTAKNQEVLEQLYQLVVKQASAPKPVATGVPGKDTNVAAVSEKNDKVDQNAVKPETLAPQAHEQKASTDPAAPAKKASSDVEKLGTEILDLVQKFANNPVATGVPAKDPKWEAVSAKHDTVNQNAVKPETNPQGYHQHPATDPSTPTGCKCSAEQEAVDKVASYELGKLWAEMVIKKAQDDQLEVYKEAGRRDFETLIAQATEQMRQEKQAAKQYNAYQTKVANTINYAVQQEQEKQAEAAGAAAFQSLYKQAQAEQAAEHTLSQILAQNQQMAAKLAEFQQYQLAKEAELNKQLLAKQAELDKLAAEEKEQQKFAALASHLEQRIIDRLQREVVGRS